MERKSGGKVGEKEEKSGKGRLKEKWRGRRVERKKKGRRKMRGRAEKSGVALTQDS